MSKFGRVAFLIPLVALSGCEGSAGDGGRAEWCSERYGTFACLTVYPLASAFFDAVAASVAATPSTGVSRRPEVLLSGTAFVSPSGWRCCPPDAGVIVEWSNAATGEAGTAVSLISGQDAEDIRSWMHTWQARVPLATGSNPIKITAFDQAGIWTETTMIVTRVR